VPHGLPVTSLPIPHNAGFHLFHASTEPKDGATVTGGGRCFTAVGVADTLDEAKWLAYEGVAKVAFPGSWYRKDIGDKFQRR